MSLTTQEQIHGVLLGTALGDALGLPAEGLSRKSVQRRFRGGWRHRFVFGRGMCSDDTEHTILVAQALLASDSVETFERQLAWGLRWWLLGLPAGIGFATLRAIIRLWMGFPPRRSGVFSAGNGPAMRVAPLAARFAHQPEKLEAYVFACTRITHSDPKALCGARAVAYAIAWLVREKPQQAPAPEVFANFLRQAGDDVEWRKIVGTLEQAALQTKSVDRVAADLGLQYGVGGYIYHSVPIALYAWYRHFGDFRATLEAVFRCGGDTDTVGAISGALAGCSGGLDSMPQAWRTGLWEWPRGKILLAELAKRLCHEEPQQPVRYFWPVLLPRNLFFMLVVLLHGLRRLVPF